eukprot:Gb_40649 [translate_table: standard]
MSSISTLRFSAAAAFYSAVILPPTLLNSPMSRFPALIRCQCRAAPLIITANTSNQRNKNICNCRQLQTFGINVSGYPLRTAIAPRRVKSASVDTMRSEEESTSSNLEEAAGEIMRLQNGSDVRGIAMEGEEGREVNLTPAAVYCIAEAFGEWVGKSLGKPATKVRVSLGRDPRLTGPSLTNAAAGGLRNAACSVYDMGLATTPACFMSTVLPGFNYDASIMLTASHLPYTRNGLKFFTSNGGLNVDDVEQICSAAASKYVKIHMTTPPTLNLAIEKADFMPVYAEHLRNIIKTQVNHPTNYEKPLQGFKVNDWPSFICVIAWAYVPSVAWEVPHKRIRGGEKLCGQELIARGIVQLALELLREH